MTDISHANSDYYNVDIITNNYKFYLKIYLTYIVVILYKYI